ncbi:uncharacterized protein KY384_007442 [Bacidia gigantensis]|uniref:uncharacterized protein n=1 Tax=Bacidia gigantensis TaxID=2732470 RepID=UPI001D04BA3B|nr:uncharacterized protein KY384_007442 [Bacidia gigantensis]KAG8528524.1 hypothetical protein KY384_007442 [Bacidia gigantensis]
MAAVKALEGRTVHQIQSGQVIVDLCSVAKELVENSLDAGATAIEVRFKNHGLDSIEVQDNGSGISENDYESIALKHYTSKLSTYNGLSSLETFGFRGEALSSLSALSKFCIITAKETEAPKGTRLDFEISGQLRGKSVIASQRGTTVIVENLFQNLPVRRRELEKNIKREYSRVLNILQAYACINTQARISLSNYMTKGKKVVVFATKGNHTTRENIANVFGAKSLTNLLSMNLALEMAPTGTAVRSGFGAPDKQVRAIGHVSRPVFGEGRQAPDRQMFFVNSRPCGLPQVAKIFNEVYKSYNMAQSPFVFANIMLDTNAYDVNVSPDKRTILLHDQAALLEGLRASLTGLFDYQDQTVPQSVPSINRLPSYKQLSLSRESSMNKEAASVRMADSASRDHSASYGSSSESDEAVPDKAPLNLIEQFAARGTTARLETPRSRTTGDTGTTGLSKGKQKLLRKLDKENHMHPGSDDFDDARDVTESDRLQQDLPRAVRDFNDRLAEHITNSNPVDEPEASSNEEEAATTDNDLESAQAQRAPQSSIIHNAFDRMRPRRRSPEVPTVTIESKTTDSIFQSLASDQRRTHPGPSLSKQAHSPGESTRQAFSSSMRAFAAPESNFIPTVGPPRSKLRPSKHGQHHLSRVRDGSNTSDDEAESPSQMTEDESLDEASEDSEHELNATESDLDYIDEDEKKAMEERRVAEIIKDAEAARMVPSEESSKRARQVLKGSITKDSTHELMQKINTGLDQIGRQLKAIQAAISQPLAIDTLDSTINTTALNSPSTDPSAPDRLTLTITKQDFSNLHIIGQFNLGFILALRNNTDLFIIDQHASDEKVNFEHLQATTVMQNQRLVHPRRLDLSAVDEEIILENEDVLMKNGFVVEVDQSGDFPVGQRVSLVSLPMSRETTFRPSDLEELVAILADAPSYTIGGTARGGELEGGGVPRPSKIRKLLAMRACRSSIMIGKVMTKGMMGRLVGKMGKLDKPWNCPHGRPTMRHVCGLEGLGGDGEEEEEVEGEGIDWGAWVEKMVGVEGGEIDGGGSEGSPVDMAGFDQADDGER